MAKTDETTHSLDRWLQLPAETLLNILKGSCRLCMSDLLHYRISLFVTERNGIRLLEMANDLTGLQISDQSDCGIPMDVCLNCAGKLVNFYEFREACNQNEEEFDTIHTAIRLKLKFNQTTNEEANDEDMQVIYVCRTCKVQFESNKEYLEHKATHNASAMSTTIQNNSNGNVSAIAPSDTSSTENSMTERSEAVQIDELGQVDLTPVKMETNEDDPSTSNFETALANDDELHVEAEHNQTVPPLILRKLTSMRRTRGSNILMASQTIPEQIDVNVNPDDVSSLRKQYKCDKCPMVFSGVRDRMLHVLREHKAAEVENRKRGRPAVRQICKHCGTCFDTYIQKYRHEKQCGINAIALKKRRSSTDDAPTAFNESHDDSKIKCSRCPEEFSSSRAKTIHERDVHNLDLRECRVCKRIFSSYPARYIHEKRCVLNPPPPQVVPKVEA